MSSYPVPVQQKSHIARIILAATMVLVMLAGIWPLSSWASSHRCRMACCAGKSPHDEGSCSVAFASQEQAQESDEYGAEMAHHAAHHQAQHASHQSSPPASFASQAMTTPCSPACAAAQLSSTQLRRPRETAELSINSRPRPPTTIAFKQAAPSLLLLSGERRRQTRPRAPPRLLINLSA